MIKTITFQEQTFRDIVDGQIALKSSLPGSKHEFAVQGTTGCGKTKIAYRYIQHFFNNKEGDKKALFYFSPSNGGLTFQVRSVMENLDGVRVSDTTELIVGGVVNNTCYTIGYASINKRTNKLTFERLKQVIEDASAEGFTLVLIIDEAHSNRDMVEKLVNLPFNFVTYMSATLPAYIDERCNVRRCDGRSYWNSVVIGREEVKSAGLIRWPVSINDEMYMNEKNLKEAKLLAARHAKDGIKFNQDFYLVFLAYKYIRQVEEDIEEMERAGLCHPDTGEPIQFPKPCVVILLQDNRGDINAKEDYEETAKDVEKILKYGEICGFLEDERGVWTAKIKLNVEDLNSPENNVKFLVSKQAIKEGWDCPRCCGVVKLRDTSNWTFETQVVGRASRNPLLVTEEAILTYSKNQSIFAGKNGEKLKACLRRYYTPMVMTFSRDMGLKLKEIYGRDVIGGINRKQATDVLNASVTVDMLDVFKHITVNGFKTRLYNNVDYANDSIFLNMLSSEFAFFMADNIYGAKPITIKTKDIAKQNKSNISKLSNCHYDFSGISSYFVGKSDGDSIMMDRDKLVERKTNVKMQYRMSDIEPFLRQTAKLLSCSMQSAYYFWGHVVSKGRLLDGDVKLLMLDEIDTLHFLYKNGTSLLGWLRAFDVLNHTELLPVGQSNKYGLDVTALSFRPYWDAVSRERDLLNYLFDGVKADYSVTERGHVSKYEQEFERLILDDRKRAYFCYLHNGSDGEPFYTIAYISTVEVLRPDGFYRVYNPKITKIDTYRNFYPDYLSVYVDDATKTIYCSILELKLPFGCKDGYPNNNLQEKFDAMVTENLRLQNLFAGYKTTNGYQVKVSLAFVKQGEGEDNHDFYALFADDNSNAADLLAERPTVKWERFDTNDVLESKVKAHAK